MYTLFHNRSLVLATVVRMMYKPADNLRKMTIMPKLRSVTTTKGRKMAGIRSLWRANEMKRIQMDKPLIAINEKELAKRHQEKATGGTVAFKPVRQRHVSPALKACALFAATDQGEVRIIPE